MSDETTPTVRGMYDRNTLAEYLSVSVDQVDKLFREGIIPSSVPFGMKRGRRCTHAAVEEYIATSMGQAPQPALAEVVDLQAVAS